jgi:hypothetical protein
MGHPLLAKGQPELRGLAIDHGLRCEVMELRCARIDCFVNRPHVEPDRFCVFDQLVDNPQGGQLIGVCGE